MIVFNNVITTSIHLYMTLYYMYVALKADYALSTPQLHM